VPEDRLSTTALDRKKLAPVQLAFSGRWINQIEASASSTRLRRNRFENNSRILKKHVLEPIEAKLDLLRRCSHAKTNVILEIGREGGGGRLETWQTRSLNVAGANRESDDAGVAHVTLV
jgi:hypothetical protein